MKLSITGNLIRLRDVQYWNAANGQWEDVTGTVGATLTASILNSDTAQTGVANAQTIPMAHDAPTTSDWSCVMPANVTLADGVIYYVLINITISGTTVPIRQRFTAAYPDGSVTP